MTIPSFVPNTPLTTAQLNAMVAAINSLAPIAASVVSTLGATFTGPCYFQVGTATAPGLSFAGYPGTGFYPTNAGTTLGLSVQGVTAAQFVGVPLGVNYPVFTAGATGSGVTLSAFGTDATVGFVIQDKGGAGVQVTSNNVTAFKVQAQAAATNWIGVQANPTGFAAQIYAWGDTNTGLALTPRGTGALTAHVPDLGTAGGNQRGSNAVDWQTSRSAATQVASAGSSTIAGGQTNTASAIASTVGGGSTNIASGVTSTVAGGSTNTASGLNSTVPGGSTNTASASNATAGGGISNTASGVSATIAGGNSNTASGTDSWVPGGVQASDRGLFARGAWSAGQFATAGDAQAGEYVLRRQTTDATSSRLTGNAGVQSSTTTVNLPNNGTYLVRYMVLARQTGGAAGTAGDSAGWTFEVLFTRGAAAANTAFVGGTVQTSAAALAAIVTGTPFAPSYNIAAAAAWRLTLSADTVQGGIGISAIGEASKNINWVARVLSVEAVG